LFCLRWAKVLYDSVTCRDDIDVVLDWMIGLLHLIRSQLGTTGNYSAVADLHTLQSTVTHALGFSVFTSRILATDFYTVVIPISQ
jgi:hypothetical protein